MTHHRADLPLSGEHSVSGSYASISRCRRCGIVIGFGERCEFCLEHPRSHEDAPGDYFGRHHTEWITTVDELLIRGDDDQAEFLLWKLIQATESEASGAHTPPLERHFTRLAQLARRRNDERLVREIRNRYVACAATARRRSEIDHRQTPAV